MSYVLSVESMGIYRHAPESGGEGALIEAAPKASRIRIPELKSGSEGVLTKACLTPIAHLAPRTTLIKVPGTSHVSTFPHLKMAVGVL